MVRLKQPEKPFINSMNLKKGDFIKYNNGIVAEIVVEDNILCTKTEANIPGEKDVYCYQPLSAWDNNRFKILTGTP